jgi:two-component system, NarL family, invasion response regulator UvrY
MTSALIVDDHPVVLQGCRRILEDAGITTVFEASDTATGYELSRNHRPDVVVIDLSMRGVGLGGLS